MSPDLRRLLPAGIDAAAWLTGLVAAVWTRYEFGLSAPLLRRTLLGWVLVVAVHATISRCGYLYRGRHRFASFEEVRALTLTVAAAATTLLLADLALTPRPLPLSTPVVGAALALVLMFSVRYLRRLARQRAAHRPPADPTGTPVLLFGAGAAGWSLLCGMRADRRCRYVPVGLLDDDPAKRHLRLGGLPVLGGRADIPQAVARTGARAVVLSVANADAQLIRDIGQHVRLAGVALKVVPSVSELLDARISVSDVRDPRISDLLGRHQIETDLDAIAGYLAGKRVLVTGAGGSIGSELCRQINRFSPAELMMLDRDESALHAVQLSLTGRALLDTPDLILADIRDAVRLRQIFAERRPQVVFHAAALKHLPLLQAHPTEAVKTNVYGTLHVLDAAARAGVERFVNISTDKAANPVSVLGYTKRITERLTAHRAGVATGAYLSVRFGNVLGSRGSVLTAFTAQAAVGGPITVTHPDVTRYFMTVQEAVQLVIQSAVLGRPGEALVLDMGRPVRIAEVARQIADRAGAGVEIVYTGLRSGEKLHEELFGTGELDVRPLHPLISHVDVPALDPALLDAVQGPASGRELTTRLAALCASDAVPVGVGAREAARPDRPWPVRPR